MPRLDCIENYIVLRDGCYRDENGNAIPTPEPVSGYYVEDLEGISVDNVAMVTPEKLFSATNTVIEKLYFAADVVQSRLKAILNARGVRLTKIGKTYEACKVLDTASGPIGLDRGLRISKKWILSPQSLIWVDSIKIKSTLDGQTTLKIKDASGTVLWSKTVSVLANDEQAFVVRRGFKEDIILVTADSTSIGMFQYQCDETTSCKPCAANNELLSIQGWNGSGISSVGFLGVCVRIDCTDAGIICEFLDRLGLAILYQLGAEILKEWTSPNNRINIIRDHGEEWAMTKMKDFEILSIEYLDNEILNIIDILQTDKYCYNCKGRIIVNPMLP